MTYNVFSGTLNPTQSINQHLSAFRQQRRPDNQTDGVEVVDSLLLDTSYRLECHPRIDVDSGRGSQPAVSDQLYTTKRE